MIMRVYRLRNYRKRNEKLDAKDVLPNIQSQTARRPPKGPKNAADVHGDLDLQTRQSEGSKTSSR